MARRMRLLVVVLVAAGAAGLSGCRLGPFGPDGGGAAAGLSALVTVPAGRFTMGLEESSNSHEMPAHEVQLSSYQIGRYEVTADEYAAVLNWALGQGLLQEAPTFEPLAEGGPYAGGLEVCVGLSVICRVRTAFFTQGQLEYVDGAFVPVTDPSGVNLADHPMGSVTWYGAVAYCQWLSQMEGLTPCYDLSTWTRVSLGGWRLPTEAEWERAASWDLSGVKWAYGFSADVIDATRANYGNANPLGLLSWPRSTGVGYYDGRTGTVDGPSPVGCYDMTGNVAEWVEDWWDFYPYLAPGEYLTDPVGPATGDQKMTRGGAYDDVATVCRAMYRDERFVPYAVGPGMGLRVARTVAP